MPRLIWAPAALRDIARLRAFLAPKNLEAAQRAVAAIRQGVRLLRDHPEAGRPVEAMAPEFREWPIGFGLGGYVALYHFDGTEVVILAVRHGRELGF
jgi:plasmid stabilization system protein ParE